MKRTITKEFSWDCAHRLYDPKLSDEENRKAFGKCVNMHGHTYKLFVTISLKDDKIVEINELNQTLICDLPEKNNGMIINFVKLKELVNQYIVNVFDHTNINDNLLYKNRLSSCENQVVDIWRILNPLLEIESNCILEEIKLYETPTSFATLTR